MAEGRFEGTLPYGLTFDNFREASLQVDEILRSVNSALSEAKLAPIHDVITTPATLSALISDLFAFALAVESVELEVNRFHNGHPDLLPVGVYPGDGIQSGDEGVEVKATKNVVADAHGARAGWWCQVRYRVPERLGGSTDNPMIHQVCLARFDESDFRKNARKTETGTRTATPAGEAVRRLNQSVVYDCEWLPAAPS
jgi:hypothetical protein